VGDVRADFVARSVDPEVYDIRIFRCYQLDEDRLCFERRWSRDLRVFFGILSLAEPKRRIPFAATLSERGLLMAFGRAEDLFSSEAAEPLYPGAARWWNRLHPAALFGEYLQLHEVGEDAPHFRHSDDAATPPAPLYRRWHAVSRATFLEPKAPGWPFSEQR
jgi:hypothetical protein